jgi:hypothetical protein
MKIESVESFILNVPLPRFVADSFNQALIWGLPGVLIRTDEGITGTGYTSTQTGGDNAIKEILDRSYTPKSQLYTEADRKGSALSPQAVARLVLVGRALGRPPRNNADGARRRRHGAVGHQGEGFRRAALEARRR